MVQLEITKDMEGAYIKSPFHCPACKSENISADGIDPEGMFQKVECEDCQAEWIENYAITSIEELEIPDPEEADDE